MIRVLQSALTCERFQMFRIVLCGMILSATIGFRIDARADVVPGDGKTPEATKTNTSPPREYPPTYAGRTLEEWKRLTVTDFDYQTRYQGYKALAAFAVHGHEKEALAAFENVLAKEDNWPSLANVYEAVKSVGKPGEPILVRGLGQKSPKHVSAILWTLRKRENIRSAPGDELVDALLGVIQMKDVESEHRESACRAVAVQVMAFAYLPRDQEDAQPNPAIDPQLKRMVPVLQETLKDKDGRVGNGAAYALMQISISRPKLMAAVLDYLDAQFATPRPGHSYQTTVTGLLNDLSEFQRQFRARETLLMSLPHLKSIQDKYMKDPSNAGVGWGLSNLVSDLERPTDSVGGFDRTPQPRRSGTRKRAGF